MFLEGLTKNYIGYFMEFYTFEHDAEYLLKRVKVGIQYGVIVDFSNSHGLCFGVVFPNIHGNSGRTETLEIKWFEPEEIEIL